MEEQPQSCWVPFCELMLDNLLCPGSPPALSLEDCLRSPSARCQVQEEEAASEVKEAEALAAVGDSMSFCDLAISFEHQTVMASLNVFCRSSSFRRAYICQDDRTQAWAQAY